MSYNRVIGFFIAVIFAATFSAAAQPVPSTCSVLFVGNSLTQVNDLPGTLQRFAAATPLHARITVHATAPSGAFLYDHWRKGDAVRMLREQRPNVLILQGQSSEPLTGPRNFDYYAGLLKKEADSVGASTILFSTWAHPAGAAYYKDPSSGGSPNEMQKRLNAAYASLGEKLKVKVAPVGIAWARAHLDAPEIKLLDGSQHPSPAGTYLAAAVLFRALFEAPEANSSYYGSLPKETALALQRIATAVPLTPPS